MSESHSHHDLAKHIKVYWVVFFALLVGTAVTVGLNYMHFDSLALTIGIAMFVATVKAFLVAGYFMHLLSEKKMIYAILLTTVFFLVGMMFLVIWGRDQLPRGSSFFGSHNSSSTPAISSQ